MSAPRVVVARAALALLLAGTWLGARDADANANADAETIRDKTHRYELRVPRGWRTLPVDAAHTEPLRAMRSPDGRTLLAVSRVNFPNPMAWRSERQFFRVVEQGVRSAAPGYKRLRRKRRRLSRVPTLDLVFEQDRAGSREVVAMRLLFFRRYTLTLAISQPRRTYKRRRRATRKLLESFKPYLKR